MSANDVLSFSVGGEIVTDYTVTQDDMDAGFEQNLTVEGTSGICGNVTDDGKVNIGDVIRLANNVGFPA